MKTFIRNSLILLAGAIAFAGCSGNAGGSGGETPEVDYIKLSPGIPIVFTAAADEHHDITVTTDQASWKVDSDQEWCKVSEQTAAGFRITALPNTRPTPPPTATVTVSAGEVASATIIVSQMGYIKPEDKPIEVIMFVYSESAPVDRRVLCVMKPDGTGARIVHDSADPANDTYPLIARGALHPDGTKAVVLDNDYNMFVYDLDGGTLSTVGTAGADWKPDEAVWSPDGKHILYCNWADQDNTRLETIKPDGTGISQLTGDGYTPGRPGYTPDGTRIIATDFLEYKFIYSMGSDGADITEIVEAGDGSQVDCAWPLNDSRIIYYAKSDGAVSLCAAGSDGSDPAELTEFDAAYITADYLSANAGGSKVCYTLMDETYVKSVFVSSFDGTALGAGTKLLEGDYIRARFGVIMQSLYDELPEFDPDGGE